MGAPSMIEVVAAVMKNRGHADVPQKTVEAIAGMAEGLGVAAGLNELERGILAYEQDHPVPPPLLRRRAGHIDKQSKLSK